MIDEALQRLEAEDLQKARIVSLKIFGGLNNEESGIPDCLNFFNFPDHAGKICAN